MWWHSPVKIIFYTLLMFTHMRPCEHAMPSFEHLQPNNQIRLFISPFSYPRDVIHILAHSRRLAKSHYLCSMGYILLLLSNLT